MGIEKIFQKDKEKQKEKYLIFLDYVLAELKNGRIAGISLRNLSDKYKMEMGTTLDKQEQKEFIDLYEGEYFDKVAGTIDRLKIKDKTIKTILKHGSIREYLKQENQESLSKTSKPKSMIYRLAQNPIIQIMSIIVIVYSFLKIIEAIFNVKIPYI